VIQLTRTILLAIFSATCCLAGPQALAQSGGEKLHVMLQGASSQALARLVVDNGGEITHDIHLIGAVGARLSSDQLEKVLLSPLVERHIDDLSVRPAEEDGPDEKPSCDVGGSLELDFEAHGISWPYFNKIDQPARLEQIDLRWPPELGDVTTMSIGGQRLDKLLKKPAGGGALSLKFAPESAPAIRDKGSLNVIFARFPQSGARPLQSDFNLEIKFRGGCSTRLIPGYTDNHLDFYYSGVVGADQLHLHGVTGKGVTVAVLDSGLWESPCLAKDTSGRPRVIARYDAILGRESPDEVFDESGHGTHMTSVLAHSGPTIQNGQPTGSFKGIAPDVSLVAVKAFNHEGQGELLDIVRGIQWVVDNREKYDIRVLNLSFASRPRWNYWLDPVNQAAMHAWANGIAVIAAAGNEGPEPMTVGSPGNLPYAITVGAVTDSWTPTDRDDDYIPDFSSRGPTPSAHIKPDLVAPGGHITGITRPNSTLIEDYPEYLLNTGEFVMSGSSQASAVVAGIAALLLQLEPDLTPDDLKCKLTSSAEPAINSDGLLAYSPFQQGHGYVSVTRAVTLGERGCGNQELDIQREIEGLEHYQGPAIVDEEGNPSLPGLSTIVSPQPSEKGLSLSRKWGAKAHIERSSAIPPAAQEGDPHPFDWADVYFREKARIEELSREPGA
jgi:serine protease AprX